MAKHETGIQWTWVPGYRGMTWNPTTGCTRVSPGCDHCYAFQLHDQRHRANRSAARRAWEFAEERPASFPTPKEMIEWARATGVGLPVAPAQYDQPFSQVQLLEARLTEPLHWRQPRAVFVDSMADLFHEDVPDEVGWARSAVEQCRAAGLAVFVKQLGSRPREQHWSSDGRRNLGVQPLHLKHPHGGDMAEWPADLRVREFPQGLGKWVHGA